MGRRDRGAAPTDATRASRRARRRRRGPGLRVVAALAALLVVALAVSGALLVGRGQEVDPEKATPTSVVGDRVDTDGGTLNALTLGPVVTWDPQRIASRDDMAFASRVFARTLTAYAPDTDPARQAGLVGDLATDTGTPSKDLRTWTFTLRDGIKWQDGSPVTCADVAYGISRTFATDVVLGRPDRRARRPRDPAPDGRHEHLSRPLRHRGRRGEGAGRLRQGRHVQGPADRLHPERAAQRLQRAREPGGIRPGEEVGRPGRRGRLRRLLGGPVQARGHLAGRQGRHLRAQHGVEPRERPDPPGARRPDPLPGGPRHPGRGPAGHGRRRHRSRVGVAWARRRPPSSSTSPPSRACASGRSTRAPASSTTSCPTPAARCSRTRRSASRSPPPPTATPTSRRSAARPRPTPPAPSCPPASPGPTTPTRSAPAPAATPPAPRPCSPRPARPVRCPSPSPTARPRRPTRRWRPSSPAGGWPGSSRRPAR